jgi:hypothetical protein
MLAAAGTSWGAVQATAMVTVQAPMASWASLTIGGTRYPVIHFPDRDPDTTPSIAASENPLLVSAGANGGPTQSMSLTVLASGDLVAGSNTIPINNVTWTASNTVGAGFRSGSMSKTTPQIAGQWTGGNTYTGYFSYFLNNSWSYGTGNYSQTAVYTLNAP